MSRMWRRWARRRRFVGLTYLVLAAAALAVAVLFAVIGATLPAGGLAGFSLALICTAVFEFAQAAKYARLAG